MNLPSIEVVQARLSAARSHPHLKRNFPKELWEDIFRLADKTSPELIAQKLEISASFLQRKMRQRKKPKQEESIAFKELPCAPLGVVMVEITRKDLTARINGSPADCISLLTSLFNGA